MTEIIIRQLNHNDAYDFKSIRLSSLKNNPEMFGSSYAIEAARPLSMFSEVISNNVIFAAYCQDQIIGVLILHIADDVDNNPQAHLYGFFVEPQYRNQGIAKQLLHAVIQYAQLYVKKIMLSVIAINKPAIQLYKKLGFQIVTQTTKNNEHEIEMILFY